MRSQKTKFMVSDLMIIQMIPLNFSVSLMMCTTLKGIYIKNLGRTLLSFAIMPVFIKTAKIRENLKNKKLLMLTIWPYMPWLNAADKLIGVI